MAHSIITSTNVILGSGSANQLTIYSSRVAENWTKELSVITPGTTSATPNTSLLLDLLRVERRGELRGYFDEVDKTKLKNLFKTRGVIVIVNYDGETFNAIIDKMEFNKTPTPIKDTSMSGADIIEVEYLEVMITFVAGEDI